VTVTGMTMMMLTYDIRKTDLEDNKTKRRPF